METTALTISSFGMLPPHGDERRQNEVLQRIQRIKKSLLGNLFELGDLLSEVYNNHYYVTSFEQYIEESGLDISPRYAYYLVQIVDKAEQLKIPRQKLLESKISKLKEIFTLNPDRHSTIMRELVDAANLCSLDVIKHKVQSLKQEAGAPVFTFLNLKLLPEQKKVFEEAVELCRRLSGDTVDAETGEVRDVSLGTALERICVSYLQDANNQADFALSEPVYVEALTVEE